MQWNVIGILTRMVGTKKGRHVLYTLRCQCHLFFGGNEKVNLFDAIGD